MNINDLKKANMMALKNKDNDARVALSIVISRYQAQASLGKGEPTEEDIIHIVQKVCKELDEEKEGYLKANNLEKADAIQRQKDSLSSLLPKMLSEEEIKDIILTLEDKSIPSVMKHFKANYAGKCDMGLVSKIAKNI